MLPFYLGNQSSFGLYYSHPTHMVRMHTYARNFDMYFHPITEPRISSAEFDEMNSGQSACERTGP